MCVLIRRLIFALRGIPWSQQTGVKSKTVCQVCIEEAIWVTGCQGSGEGASMSNSCRRKRGSSSNHLDTPLQHHPYSFGKHIRHSDTGQTDLRRRTFTRLSPGPLACFGSSSDPPDVGRDVVANSAVPTYMDSHFDHSSSSLLLFWKPQTDRAVQRQLVVPAGGWAWCSLSHQNPHLVTHLCLTPDMRSEDLGYGHALHSRTFPRYLGHHDL